MRTVNSSTGKAVKYLMLKETKMKKVKLLVFLATIVEKDNNGRLSILTKQMDHKLRD
jgi:hypothetical protein